MVIILTYVETQCLPRRGEESELQSPAAGSLKAHGPGGGGHQGGFVSVVELGVVSFPPRTVLSISLYRRLLPEAIPVRPGTLRALPRVHTRPCLLSLRQEFSLRHLVAHEITPFPRRVPESRRWGDCRIPPGPFQPNRLRFSTGAIEVSACIPPGELPTHASARPQAGASQTHPGIRPPPWPSPSSSPPWILGLGGCSVGDWGPPGPALALGHQADMQALCLLGPRVSMDESSGQARNSGTTVACQELRSCPCQSVHQRTWRSSTVTTAIGFTNGHCRGLSACGGFGVRRLHPKPDTSTY